MMDEARAARVARLQHTLSPTDPTYCAEPIEIEDARWLLDQLAAHEAEIAQLRATLTFERFSRANRARCESPQGFNHALNSWDTSDWFLAVLGELGEAANVAKKLNRVRDGIPGNKETPDELRAKLRKELGDVFVYLDLLAQAHEFTIDAAAIEVFNAKSRELGYSDELLASSTEADLAACLHARDDARKQTP